MRSSLTALEGLFSQKQDTKCHNTNSGDQMGELTTLDPNVSYFLLTESPVYLLFSGVLCFQFFRIFTFSS